MYSNLVCLGPDTQVQMSQCFLKKIKDVVPGDEIISFNFATKSLEVTKVELVASSSHKRICHIMLEGGSEILATTDHPFAVSNKGWASIEPLYSKTNYLIEAKELCVGDCIISVNDDSSSIAQKRILAITFLTGSFKMYIISGGLNRCFFANGLLVHDENIIDLDLSQVNSMDVSVLA